MKTLVPFVALGFIVAGACAGGGSRVQSPAQAPVAAAPADFGAAWEVVSTGREPSTRADGFTFEKTGEGDIVVFRELQRVSGLEAEREQDDNALVGRVKGQLARNEKVDASFIDLTVDEGDLVMSGQVTSREEAGEIIRTALATPGVDRVVSRLTYTPLP
jgi:hypothetical protein